MRKASGLIKSGFVLVMVSLLVGWKLPKLKIPRQHTTAAPHAASLAFRTGAYVKGDSEAEEYHGYQFSASHTYECWFYFHQCDIGHDHGTWSVSGDSLYLKDLRESARKESGANACGSDYGAETPVRSDTLKIRNLTETGFEGISLRGLKTGEAWEKFVLTR